MITSDPIIQKKIFQKIKKTIDNSPNLWYNVSVPKGNKTFLTEERKIIMTVAEYLEAHGADCPYEPDDIEEDIVLPPYWLEDWEECLEKHASEFCEAQRWCDYADYIDEEKTFDSLEVGAIFLTDDGYFVKVTAGSYSKYSDDIETLDEYLYQPAKSFDNLHERVLATQFCV